MAIIHNHADILENWGWSRPSTIKTSCGKVVRQFIKENNRVDCPQCLAVMFPAHEQTNATEDTFKCWYCGKLTPISDHHFEHMTPLIRGGENLVRNLTDACSNCNLRKGTRTAQEFLRTFK